MARLVGSASARNVASRRSDTCVCITYRFNNNMVIHMPCGCQGSGDASDGLRPPPSGVLDQEIEEARFADEFLNARGGADDPQHTMRGRGQVVHLNQLADAA